MRVGFFVIFGCVFATHALSQKDGEAGLWEFVGKHCADCHDDASAKGGLDLYQLDAVNQNSSLAGVTRWTQIYDRIKSGEMPPLAAKSPRPGEAEVTAFLGGLKGPLHAADRRFREVTHRRLNRHEYENTIGDLFGIELNVKHLLPEDQSAGGFDNNGAALAISAELIQQYLAAARFALDRSIVSGEQPEQRTFSVDSIRETKRYFGKQYGFHQGRVVAYLTDRGDYSKISTRDKRIPVRGAYRFRFTAAAHNSQKAIVFSVRATGRYRDENESRHLGYFEAKPEVREFEIVTECEAGAALQFFAHGLPIWINDPDQKGSPGVGYGPVEITGPLLEQWPPPSHRQLLGDTDLENGSLPEARAILMKFASRAFRQPVTDEELKPYLNLVTAKQAEGQNFAQSLRTGLEAILCSTRFLFLREETGQRDSLSKHELASRLSYFLWAGPPDEKLLAALAGGVPVTKSVKRMLDDDRSERFVENFLGQWLNLRDINATTPDEKLYSNFDEVLQYSMVRESREFFRHLLDEDLSIANFLDSNFAMLNERLAEHYEIPGVTGLEMRPVPLPKDSPRGGVLAQAALLKVTANGTNTSPVIRGAWVLENILGKHIPPPPPNVDGIEPDIRSATTIREQLDLHRNSDSCRNCHQHIDPPGFALESFDPVGAFRKNYLRFQVNPRHADKGWGSVVAGKEVDASGQFASGNAFGNFFEFRELLAKDPRPFAECLTERLLTYALGRELGFSDRDSVKEIAGAALKRGGGLRTLIEEIAGSEIFANP